MRTRRCVSPLALTAVILFAPGVLRTAIAQDHSRHDSHAVSSNPLRLEVDGSRNPERVSDYIAYRRFILAASVRDDSADI